MDWDAAYDNTATVDDRDFYVNRWVSEAAGFRDEMVLANRCELDLAYGPGKRSRVDIFHPEGNSKGLVIFVHGGYWRMLDKSYWSHLAAGVLSHGFAFAVPSYTLAPQARIREITNDIVTVTNFLGRRVEGSIYMAGHSAGGHLVARMACDDVAIEPEIAGRICHIVPISGLNDLEPLTKTAMNEDLQIDAETVEAESPVRLNPRSGVEVTSIVGGKELPEFLRHNLMLGSWNEKGAQVKSMVTSGYHHFDVIDSLEDPNSEMVRILLQL